MYVHFRRRYRRLAVGIGQSQYVNGKSQTAFAASLGSVALPEPITLPERRTFWAQLDSRFAAIAARFGEGRVTADDRAKIVAALDCRIRRPTETEEVKAAIKAANRQAARKHAARTRQSEQP